MTSVQRGLRFLEMFPVMLLATWARVALFPRVLVDGGISPGAGDSEYHLRRILLAFETFPKVSVFDPLLAWPAGAAHPWAPGFDWAGAALLHLTFLEDPASLAFAAALYPVLLGLLCVWLVMDLSARVLPPGAHRLTPLAAGALAALVPQFVGASRLARTDHHVWEALSVLLLLRWVLAGLELTSHRRPWRFEALGLATVVVTLTGFVGGPLYVALIIPVLLIRPVLDEVPLPLVGSGALALLGGGALTALINLGPISEHGRVLSFGYPSLLQPFLALSAAAVVALAVLVARASPSATRRLGLLVGGALGLALTVLFAPGLGPQVRGGLADWLWKKDPWLSGISEFQPLFSMGRPPLETVLTYLGLTGLLAVPLLLVALGLQRGTRRSLLAFTFVFTALLGLTVLQMRFGRVLAPLLGVACALGLSALVQWAGPRTRLLTLVGTLALTAGDREVRRELVLADPRAPSPIEALADGLVLQQPPQAGKREGVLASWELGDTLLSRARRPVIASGFGSYVDAEGFRLSHSAFGSDEGALLEVMKRRDLGFVVTGAAVLFKQAGGQAMLAQTPEGVRLNTAAMAQRPVSVLMVGGSGVVGVVKHAEHLMPRQASGEQLGGLDWPLPLLWTYEWVEGATVTERCAPGGDLRARLEGRVGDRSVTWWAWEPCPPSGVATLRLCVPSGFVGPGLATGPAWQVRGEGERLVAVDEDSIRQGAPR